MDQTSKTLIFLVNLLLISLVHCDEFECPNYGTLNEKKVPDILNLIDKQNGYYATVEVNNKDRENLVHEYFNVHLKIGFIDLEAMNQEEMNRRYYYHDTAEKIAIRKNTCTRMDLTQTEKVESVKDWFEPANIVENSEIFKDFIHFGPSALMIYAHSISGKASFVGTEQIDGRSIDHWFYCINKNGPYIDFYFDAVTSYPFRFSLFNPKMVQNKNETVQGEDDRYVYNFFIFKPLVISIYEPIPYPVSYGCTRKDSSWTTPLPDFTTKQKFTLDMEAIVTYPSGQVIKSTARVMKIGEVYSYEITESEGTIRSIENPPPLGRWEVDEYTGRCRYFTSQYNADTTLITRWPFFIDRGFNLLYYIVMKPDPTHNPNFIGTIDLGPLRIEEYVASNFFNNLVDAVVDYHYPVVNGSISAYNIPSKIVFTKDRTYIYDTTIPNEVEVTIIDYRDNYFDYEDRFDVSGCYEDRNSYSWFQVVFSNPWVTSSINEELIRSEIQDFLIEFVPITRISDIVVDNFDSNIYATVKLLDRIHFIDAYSANKEYKLDNPDKILKHWRVEDCEEACTANPSCTEFSYCNDFSCDLGTIEYRYLSQPVHDSNCTYYSIQEHNQASRFLNNHLLSPTRFILHEIRRKISNNELYLSSIGSTAEEFFIVHGPNEIGDVSQNDFSGPPHFMQRDDYTTIKPGRKFSSGIATEVKVEYTECLGLCSNDDNCNTISYCPNQNKECILSAETSLTLTNLDSETTAADGCNIYEKSFMNYFTKYPGKSLVVDAALIKDGIHFTDCAKECVNAKDFNCESFDYCGAHHSLNDSVCFLHVHHITADVGHEVNASNWKFAGEGCDHFSKKSDHDYRHVVAHEFSSSTEVIGTHEEIPLQDCANRCNGDPRGCYTFEYCETVKTIEMDPDIFWMLPESTWIKSTCRMSNVKPSDTSNTNDPEFKKYFSKSSSSDRICSVYINQEKIHKTNPGSYDKLNGSFGSKDRTSLAFGLGSFFFILAFAVGVFGFIFAIKRQLISV